MRADLRRDRGLIPMASDFVQVASNAGYEDEKGFLVAMEADGAVQVETLAGSTFTIAGLSAGDMLMAGGSVPVVCVKIIEAGTTANTRAVYLVGK